MPLIKYYSLESRSWENVSDLERNLHKHLLSGKFLRMNGTSSETDLSQKILAATTTPIKELSSPSKMDKDLQVLIYDSGEFDVMYKKTWEMVKGDKGKKRWFRIEIGYNPFYCS